MQPQGSHAKPSIRRTTNGRVVLSDDEDDEVSAPRPPAPTPAAPSQPRNATPAVRDARPSSEAGRVRHAGEANQPHRRVNTHALGLAVRNHLEPQQARTVPQKRKEPATAATAAGPSSLNGTTAGDGPSHIPDDQPRAAKRVRHSPPVPTTHTPTGPEALAAELAAKAPAAAIAVATTEITNPVVTRLPAVPPDVPSADDRPPPPPPLMPFKRPKPSPTPSADSTPASASTKRKRALSFGPGDEVSAKDQAAPAPAPQKKKAKSIATILAESESRAKEESSTPRSHTPIPGSGSSHLQASSSLNSRPATPSGVAESTPHPAALDAMKETPSSSHTQPPLVASRFDEKQQASGAPVSQPRHRNRVDVEKDAQFRRPTPKAVSRPEKAKGKDTDGEVPVPQRARPGVADASREEKGKARAKVEGNSGKSRTMDEERQTEKKAKPRAPPEPDLAQSAAPKKKKLPPLSSILTQVKERKQKEQTATLLTGSQSRQSQDPLPNSSSKLAELPPPERLANAPSSIAVSESTHPRHGPPASVPRPSPVESAAPSAPPPKKKKLLTLSSIVKESEQRQQAGTALPVLRRSQDAGKPVPAEPTSSSDHPVPQQPDLLSASHSIDKPRTPPAPVQESLLGPAVEESPRLMMAIKRASSELSHIPTLNSGQLPHKPTHQLDALLMLADTAAMAPTVPKIQQERLSSESRRESSNDTTLSVLERALQRTQSELAHTEGHESLPKRTAPRRKLSELLEDEDDYPAVEDNSQSRDNAAIVSDGPKDNRAATPQPLLGLLGLGAYGSSPEPEDQEDEPPSPIRLALPSVEIAQSRASDTRKQSSPSAAVDSEAPSTDLPLKPHSSLLDPGSSPSVVQSSLHEVHPAPSSPPSQPPPRAHPEHRRASSRMVIHSPETGAEDYSPPHSPPAQSASPERGRKRSRSSSPAWPAEPASEAPAPEPAAQETPAPAPAPAPAKKKYGSFKKIKQPLLEELTPPAPAREPEKEKAPAPKRVPAHLPLKPSGLPPKPVAAPAAAPTPFGRQLPPEHSSRDLDPTSVLSSVLGKPKRDSGITPEQRREWDQRKAADRAAREAEYDAQGPPLRMQKQMQTIIQYENKFKAKRTNVAPNIVAAAFKQRWEKTHGPWMPPMPGRRPPQESGPPPGAHGRPLPPTPNDRPNAKSSSQAAPMWRPLNGGVR